MPTRLLIRGCGDIHDAIAFSVDTGAVRSLCRLAAPPDSYQQISTIPTKNEQSDDTRGTQQVTRCRIFFACIGVASRNKELTASISMRAAGWSMVANHACVYSGHGSSRAHQVVRPEEAGENNPGALPKASRVPTTTYRWSPCVYRVQQGADPLSGGPPRTSRGTSTVLTIAWVPQRGIYNHAAVPFLLDDKWA